MLTHLSIDCDLRGRKRLSPSVGPPLCHIGFRQTTARHRQASTVQFCHKSSSPALDHNITRIWGKTSIHWPSSFDAFPCRCSDGEIRDHAGEMPEPRGGHPRRPSSIPSGKSLPRGSVTDVCGMVTDKFISCFNWPAAMMPAWQQITRLLAEKK